MMTSERWIRWTPVPELIAKCHIRQILDDEPFLKIQLQEKENPKRKYWIIFEEPIFYRNINDSFDCFLPGATHDENGEALSKHTCFKVFNSPLIRWLTQELGEKIDKEEIYQFSFVGTNEVVDVVSTTSPLIKGTEND